MRWSVEFYQTPSGRRPAEEWLKTQSSEIRGRFAYVAQLLEEYGLDVGRPHVAPVREGMWDMGWRRADGKFRTAISRLPRHASETGEPDTPRGDISEAQAEGAPERELASLV